MPLADGERAAEMASHLTWSRCGGDISGNIAVIVYAGCEHVGRCGECAGEARCRLAASSQPVADARSGAARRLGAGDGARASPRSGCARPGRVATYVHAQGTRAPRANTPTPA